MKAFWDLLSNNALISTLVAGLIVWLIPPTRSALERFFRWLARVVMRGARGLVSRVRKVGAGKAPATIDVSSYVKERDDLKAEVEGLKSQVRANVQYERYGEVLLEFTPLPEVRHEDVVTRVSEMLPTTRKLFQSCEEVWKEVRPRHGEGDPDTAVTDLIGFLEQHAHYPFTNVAKALYERLQARHDPRAYLVAFYKRYREWRKWIQKVSGYIGKDVRSVSNYAEWRKYDDKWREELEQKVASPNLSEVRTRLSEYNHEHGDLTLLPERDPPYTGPMQSGPGLSVR